MNRYKIKIKAVDENEDGLLTADQVRARIMQGGLNEQSLAQIEGGIGWAPLVDFAEFAEAFRTAAASTMPEAADGPEPGEPPAAAPSWYRVMLNTLLDPRSIQWLLTLGGASMVVGLIIWLAGPQFFKQPAVVAVILSLSTAVVLGLGWFVVLRTRFKMAGQALSFLACVVAPLNLWFYQAHKLATLEGRLWVGGLGCCLAYALTGWALRDPLFVYVAEGGITLTILLFMADHGVATHLPTLSAFFIGIGFISLHCERIFPPNEGPFSRRRFGMPLFWCGQLQFGIGLLILLAAQTLVWLKVPATSFPGYEWRDLNNLLAGVLWLVGAYSYLYSDIVVRRVGIYLYVAAGCLLLALTTTLFALDLSVEVVIVALACTALVVNVVQHLFQETSGKLGRATVPLALILGALPLLLGIVLHIRATSSLVGNWNYAEGWLFVLAMLVVAVGSRISAHLLGQTRPPVAAVYFFFSGAAAIVAAASLLGQVGLKAWDRQAPFLMLIPIAYILASRLWRGRPPEHPLAWVAQSATVVMLGHVLVASLDLTGASIGLRTGETANLFLALFFTEAAIFYVLAGALRKRAANIYLAAATACGALWQFLGYWQVPPSYYTVLYGVLGLVLVMVGRGTPERPPYSLAAFQSGHAVLSVAVLSAALKGLARLAASQIGWQDLLAIVLTTGASFVATCFIQQTSWRRWYATASVVLGAITFLMLNVLIHLSRGQKLEIFCVGLGLVTLALSHAGRFRKEARGDELVVLGLWMGSLLASVPLLVATIYYRFNKGIVFSVDEYGLLTITLLMLATGYIWKVKATALVGSILLVVYVGTFVTWEFYEAQLRLGQYLLIGGAVFFICGLALSIYRDLLQRLPDQFTQREGVFRVLTWR